MSGEILVSPKATARLVVTMPPEPSRLTDTDPSGSLLGFRY